MDNGKEITVFYSWQSDLPNETNRNAIRKCLREAANKIEEEYNKVSLTIRLDEATRNTAGSPNIPMTIMDKIKDSDIFIADISIINSGNPEIEKKKCPNPNVTFELGYAVAHLGWSRIIMLFNEVFGDAKDLPFDFDRHRASLYKISPDSNKGDKSALTGLLFDAINAIIKASPKKPSELLDYTAEEKRKHRDLSNLKWILSTIHLPTLDSHVINSPKLLDDKVTYFWIDFDSVINNSLFYLYNKDLGDKFKKLHAAWNISTMYYSFYHPHLNGRSYIFNNSQFGENEKNAWDAISEANKNIKALLSEILQIIRDEYIEIDIDETNSAAWQSYISHLSESST